MADQIQLVAPEYSTPYYRLRRVEICYPTATEPLRLYIIVAGRDGFEKTFTKTDPRAVDYLSGPLGPKRVLQLLLDDGHLLGAVVTVEDV